MSDTTRLALPRIDPAQAQKHVTHNEALDLIDALVHLSVATRDATDPPPNPAEGARLILGAQPTGAFVGHGGAVACFDDGAWRFLSPRKGWRAFVEAENRLYVYDGAAWSTLVVDVPATLSLRLLGINAVADAGNPLVARLNAALLTALRTSDGGAGDLRLKIDKQASANVGSQLFSTNYSGRAEAGLIGDDSYRVKVSSDGASWKDALSVDPASGRVFFPNGASDLAAAAAITTGTPAAYQLTAPLRGPLPEGALVWIVPHVPNATALGVDPTLQIDQIDAAPVPLRAFDGGPLAQGGLEAGRAVLLRKSAGAYCVQTHRSPLSLLNLLEDGGRFAGNPEPATAAVNAFADSTAFTSVNGATRAAYGLARIGSAMPAAIPELIAKIRAPAAQVAGTEFYVLQVTAGTGVTAPVAVQGTAFYAPLAAARAIPRGATGALYFRVLSGSVVLAPTDVVPRLLVDGVAHNVAANAPERVFTAAQGWKHLQMWVSAPNGGTGSFWPMRTTPGAVFLIALPAVVAGYETLPWDIGPIPSTRLWR